MSFEKEIGRLTSLWDVAVKKSVTEMRTLSRNTPINEAEEKKKFFDILGIDESEVFLRDINAVSAQKRLKSTNYVEPQFEYPPLTYDPKVLEKRLLNLNFKELTECFNRLKNEGKSNDGDGGSDDGADDEDDLNDDDGEDFKLDEQKEAEKELLRKQLEAVEVIENLYEEKRKQLLALNQINIDRGDREKVLKSAKIAFGMPLQDTLDVARMILQRPGAGDDECDINKSGEKAGGNPFEQDDSDDEESESDNEPEETGAEQDYEQGDDDDDVSVSLHRASVDQVMHLLQPPVSELPDLQLYNERRVRTAKEVAKQMRRAIALCGLPRPPWKVKMSFKRLTACSSASQTIKVCKTRMFDQDAPIRLPVHEVGVHAVRGANGRLQMLGIFGLGTAGYLPTEEGSATFFEVFAGVSSPNVMRDYASRSLAVSFVHQGLSFAESFVALRRLNVCSERAWSVCVRAFRGGGYAKDHAYLQGFLAVRQYVAQSTDDDARLLFAGKFGLDDVQRVKTLMRVGFFSKPKYLPWYVKDSLTNPTKAVPLVTEVKVPPQKIANKNKNASTIPKNKL